MDTIFALSSGSLPSGVAVVRVSGPRTRFAIETLCGLLPEARKASLRKLRSASGPVLDEGLVIWFPGPASFTGEDCCEFQVHGGRAVISALLRELGTMDGLRLAEPGEFSRRAFTNGRLDLTEIEGLADLVNAQTESQRRQAQAQASGQLRVKLEGWRTRLVRMRALLEADFDFADEEDVPGSVADGIWDQARALAAEIDAALDDGRRGEIIRDGFQIVILGPPNAGKSSLINALAKRDIAIVTSEAGTTRDLLEVHLDIDGYAVTLVDTAGLRAAEGLVEREGIRRARERAATADLIVWLQPEGEHNDASEQSFDGLETSRMIRFVSKDDNRRSRSGGISVKRKDGLEPLLKAVRSALSEAVASEMPALVTRERHRAAMVNCRNHCLLASEGDLLGTEIRGEYLRSASEEIARVTGRIDVDDLLDVIFGEFCIGK